MASRPARGPNLERRLPPWRTLRSLAQLAYIRATLHEGTRLGFPSYAAHRQHGMGDRCEDRPRSDAYEARLDLDLQKTPDVVICTYDLNHHGARTIADALVAHPVALVGGVLRSIGSAARASARDRLLTAASQLFHESGIQRPASTPSSRRPVSPRPPSIAISRRRTPLCVAWLADPRARWLTRVRAQAEAEGLDPATVISAVLRGGRRLARERRLPRLSLSQHGRRDHGTGASGPARRPGVPPGGRGLPRGPDRGSGLPRFARSWRPSSTRSWPARSRWRSRAATAPRS